MAQVPNLRRSWIIIVGSGAPAAEVDNAALLAQNLRRKLNIAKSFPDTFPGLATLVKNCNVITVGGPAANPYTVLLNDFMEPKYDFTVVREKTADETWAEYITSGGIVIRGFKVNDVAYAFVNHRGLLGSGQQPGNKLRPLSVMHIGGTLFEDTCTMTQAFIDGAEPGYYECIWPDPPDPTYAACPVAPTYTKVP